MQDKTVAELERQRIFCIIRHFIASKHQVPSYLSESDLITVLSVLVGEKQ